MIPRANRRCSQGQRRGREQAGLLVSLFGKPPDVIHYAQVDGAAHVASPEIEIPTGTDVESVPTGAD